MKSKNKFKLVFACCALTLSLATLMGCGGRQLIINDYLDAADGFDKTLFYRNDGQVQAADPSVITIGNKYYLYATNAKADTDCSYVCGWTSENLTDWQPLGAVFVPARDAWAVDSLWAPEVIEKDGKFYMYYSGYNTTKYRMGIGLAVSDKPTGPFHEIEGEFGGKQYSRQEMPFDFGFPAIDPSPFIDDDGKVYLYFSKDQVDKESSIYGCELNGDMVTIKEGSVTQNALLKCEQSWENPDITARWNEAPFMIKKNGVYYLMYSANYYENSAYAIGVAVSSTPLFGFVKSDRNPILEADPDWTFVSGTGHNSVFPSPDGTELWMAYHSHIDTVNGGSERKINFDKLIIDGYDIVVCGPSITPQPLPSGSGKYVNLASKATINTTVSGNDEAFLTDGIINYKYSRTQEYEYALSGKSKITFTFNNKVKVKAIMVYDSCDYSLSADSVTVMPDKMKFTLKFNPDFRYVDEYDFEVKQPGSAAITEFEEMEVNKITLEFNGDISLNEIVILGKEA